MTKDEFDHAIRAAGAMLGVPEIPVIGSQAVHGSVSGDLPEEALRSVGVDVAVFGDVDGAEADLLDGSIGEASIFHESFGVPSHRGRGETPYRVRALAVVWA
ncbi:MAG: hypothetical protein GXP34_07930 [Actinobacteria bacterium]|nr:hypothetical protein [Actinomycetota bacterium]